MNRARILVTGAGGILGQALSARCPAALDLVGLSRQDLDVTEPGAVRRAIDQHRPDVVLHAAAMTRVDDCESQQDEAYRVNWLGTGHVAQACAAAGCRLLYVSTDYVFPGDQEEPYVELDPTRPLSVYGRSKWAGEGAALQAGGRVMVARTQWVYGAGGRNFVDVMLERARAGQPLKVVQDQVGCPTWTGDLADGLFTLIREDPGPGIYHLSSRGRTSWFGFAQEIFRQTGLDADLSPCTTQEFPRPAPRPPCSVLRNYRLELTTGDPMPEWTEGLRRHLAERAHPKGGPA